MGGRIRVVLRLGPAPHLVLADPGQLERALLILAVNARDAMPEGGTLSIDTANVDTAATAATGTAGALAGPHLRIRVRDTGSGIPPEIIKRVFEPFFTTKDDGAGCGLGLATVQGIVNQAGGTVAVHSGASGTVFTMLFPATEARSG